MKWLLLTAIYFLPTIISGFNKRSNTITIFVGNLLLSWTVYFWFGSLVWAFCDTKNISDSINSDVNDQKSFTEENSFFLVDYVDPLIKWWKHL